MPPARAHSKCCFHWPGCAFIFNALNGKQPLQEKEQPVEKEQVQVQVQVSIKVITDQQKWLEEAKKKEAQSVEKEQAQVSSEKARIDKVGSMKPV